SSARALIWCALLRTNPIPTHREPCWPWRMGWKRNFNPLGRWSKDSAARTNVRFAMTSRREFMKEAATGALVLGAQGKLGLAKAIDKNADKGKSKVVVARDPALHNAAGQLDEK